MRFAVEETEKFEDADGDWIVLRVPNSAKDQRLIAEGASQVVMQGEMGIEIQSRADRGYMILFGTICEGWSKGDGKPTFADYDRLDAATGRWVNECVDKVVEKAQDQLGKAESSSKTPSVSRKSSRKAASPASTE